jgi:hypothetical protein
MRSTASTRYQPIFDTIGDVIVALSDIFSSAAADASSWGEGIINQLAVGMSRAFSSVIGVLRQLGSVIASWLQPHSPPKILPNIDDWGQRPPRSGSAGLERPTFRPSRIWAIRCARSWKASPTPAAARRPASSRRDWHGTGDGRRDRQRRRVRQRVGRRYPQGGRCERRGRPRGRGLSARLLRSCSRRPARSSARKPILNRSLRQYAQQLTPLNAELAKIQDQKRAIQDQKRLRDLQTEINDGKTDDLTRQQDLLEIAGDPEAPAD